MLVPLFFGVSLGSLGQRQDLYQVLGKFHLHLRCQYLLNR